MAAVLVFDRDEGKAKTLLGDLNFANGVAVSHDQSYVLVNETGNYRVIRYWLTGPKSGQAEPFIEELPAFPDNISTGLGGRFWVALVSPRNALLDKLSALPFMRQGTFSVCRHSFAPRPLLTAISSLLTAMVKLLKIYKIRTAAIRLTPA